VAGPARAAAGGRPSPGAGPRLTGPRAPGVTIAEGPSTNRPSYQQAQPPTEGV